MSYCRLTRDSDVYVYSAGDNEIVCCGCGLTGGKRRHETKRGMLEHLLRHREAGDKVPEDALERLRSEIADEG